MNGITTDCLHEIEEQLNDKGMELVSVSCVKVGEYRVLAYDYGKSLLSWYDLPGSYHDGKAITPFVVWKWTHDSGLFGGKYYSNEIDAAFDFNSK